MQNAVLDRESDDHRLIPGLWRTDVVMQEMDKAKNSSQELREQPTRSSPMATSDD